MNALATIHIAKKQLGVEDDDYRALLVRITGKASSKGMTDAEHRAVLDEFRRLGFKPGSKAPQTRRKTLSGPYAKKAQALWIALWNLGAVEHRDDAALIAFARRQTGIERLEWVLSPEDGKKVVEALKAMGERHGVVWYVSRLAPAHSHREGCKIARAQWRKIDPADERMTGFWPAVSMELKRALVVDKPSDEEWIAVMNAFGQRIRAAKKAAA